MNILNDEQRKRVAAWIEEGLKLSDIQSRIGSELGIRLTYMDVRLLVDDLKLTPKDLDRPKPVLPPTPPAQGVPPPALPSAPAAPGTPAANVTLSVDQLARPGSLVSGKVTFSDGVKSDWYLDQTGRLGLAPEQAGYRPSPTDVQQFQMALETELSKLGF